MVGQLLEIRLWAGDSFNNSVANAKDRLSVRLVPPAGIFARPVHFKLREAQEPVFLKGLSTLRSRSVGVLGAGSIPTKSGTHSLFASLAIVGGLSATYFSSDGFSAPVSSRVDSSIDFSLAANSKPAVTLTTGSAYSVRWSGFVRPQYAQLYTFFAAVQTNTERMKLWVDNSLLVDQWTDLGALEKSGTLMIGTANGYYDVVMEYKQVAGTGSVQGIKLSWHANSVVKQSLDSTRLIASTDLVGSPLEFKVLPSGVCASQSVVSRTFSPTSISVGSFISFTIDIKSLLSPYWRSCKSKCLT